MPPPLPKSRRPAPGAVRRQLERVVASADFEAPDRLRRFLRYVVEESLSGRGEGINQYAVALEVFGRDARFDPNEDPIVRIEASKLRRALERYYLTAGREDPVLIEIPKGSYQSAFSLRIPNANERVASHGHRPTLAILPFEAAEPDLAGRAAAITDELVVVLTSLPHLNVVSPATPDTRASHRVEGKIRRRGHSLRVTVHLLEVSRGIRLWADALDLETEVEAEKIGTMLGVRIGDLDGALARLAPCADPGSPRGLDDATREFQRHLRLLASETYEQARATAEEAALGNPDSPELLAVLADIHRGGFAHGFTSDENAPQRGLELARRSALLGPRVPAARLALGYARLHFREPDLAIEEAEAALHAGERSASVRGDAGVLFALAGKTERGLTLLEEAMSDLESFPGWFQHPFFMQAYERADFAKAYEAACRIRMPGLLWDPLDRAAALGMLGETERARRALQELLDMRPDFAGNPRRYIDCFVSDEEHARALLTGLEKAGLTAASA